MITFKHGVEFSKVHPALLRGLADLADLLPGTVVVTSGTDGKHMAGSFHYEGRAVDVRSKHLAPEKVEPVVRAFRATHDLEYDLLWEYVGTSNEHLHLEYDPKKIGNVL